MSIDRDIVTLQCQYIMTMFLISVMPCTAWRKQQRLHVLECSNAQTVYIS